MFLYSKWIDIALPTRIEIARIFGIVKRGSTEVFNNTIKSDGYDIKEVEVALSVGALQAHLQTSETDIATLLDQLVGTIEGTYIVTPIVEVPQTENFEVVSLIVGDKKFVPEAPPVVMGGPVTVEQVVEEAKPTPPPKKKLGRPKKDK